MFSNNEENGYLKIWLVEIKYSLLNKFICLIQEKVKKVNQNQSQSQNPNLMEKVKITVQI